MHIKKVFRCFADSKFQMMACASHEWNSFLILNRVLEIRTATPTSIMEYSYQQMS